MTREEIISMACEAGIDVGIWEKLDDQDTCVGYSIGGIHENLEAFAKLVAEKEREQCALLCEEMKYTGFGYEPEAPRLAKKIRARGNQ